MSSRIEVNAPDGIGEVLPGADLAGLIASHLDLSDGDVVLVTSKVVAKAEGRTSAMERDQAVSEESVRVVARRGPTRIARTRHGLTLAAAGVDNSNVAAGSVVLLPIDPDRSASALREALARAPGVNVAVIITDTAGRAWREGQTDIAIGAAGLRVLDDHAGRTDAYGNPLAVTAPAVADEMASAAELAQAKLGARPIAVLRGRADLVLAPTEHGPGAGGLIRDPGRDMFGYGAREAVVAALRGAPAEELRDGFGDPASAADLAEALSEVLSEVLGGPVLLDHGSEGPGDASDLVVAHLPEGTRPSVVLDALARAFGWEWVRAGAEVRFSPRSP